MYAVSHEYFAKALDKNHDVYIANDIILLNTTMPNDIEQNPMIYHKKSLQTVNR